MREIYGFLRFASRLANPFGHPSQVRTQVLVLQTCVDLRRLASPFGQGFRSAVRLRPSFVEKGVRFSIKFPEVSNHETSI